MCQRPVRVPPQGAHCSMILATRVMIRFVMGHLVGGGGGGELFSDDDDDSDVSCSANVFLLFPIFCDIKG